MRATVRLPALIALLLAGCAPPSAPAPRVDLARVAAEVVATHAARPSPEPALTASPPVPTAPAPTPPAALLSLTPAPTRPESPPTPAPTPSAVPTPRPPPTPQPAAAEPPTRTPPPLPAPAPAAPAPPAPAPLAGHLAPGGTFARFAFDYPGDRSVFTVDLQIEPDDPTLLANAGFIVYGPAGEEIVRGGAQPGLHPNVSADVIHTRPGPYLVQVHNYDPTRPLTYRVNLRPNPPPAR